MSYPEDGTAPVVQWLIGGVWTDLTAQDRLRTPIEITRARQNEQGNVPPTTAGYTLDGSDYAMSNRNPAATYYGQIPTGTQQRILAGTGDNHIYSAYTSEDQGSVRTADKAALDIVGDLELRVDVRPWTWRPAGRVMILASKYLITGDQRSWVLYLNYAGQLVFAWTTDGLLATRVTSTSTAAVPATTDRLSIKVTLDVNNGAAGNTVAFYTATTISGSYTQLGASVVTAGVTSVFSSTAALVAGTGDDSGGVFSNGIGFGGRFYGLHLYTGIAGSRVANPDFTGWALDDTSKVDSHSNTWALANKARVSSPRIRFWGELTSAEQVSDTTGRDITVPVTAADITQRLGDSRQAVQSPLSLNISPRASLLGWWHHEDGATATQAASGLPAGAPGAASGVTFGQTSTLAGAARVAELTTQASKISYRMAKGTNTQLWDAVFLFKMPDTLPATESVFATFTATGYVRTVTVASSATTFRISLYSPDSTLLDSSGVTHGAGVVVAGNWIAMRLRVNWILASFVNWELAWYQQGSNQFWGTSNTFASIGGAGVGVPTQAYLSANAAPEFAGMQISHFVMSQISLGFSTGDTSWSPSIDGYAGETAVARIKRITELADLYCEIVGEAGESVVLGPQPIDTPLKILRDVETTDGGYLTGLRDAYGLLYRTRQDVERHRDADLDYDTHLSEVPKVTDDVLTLVNDVTVSRKGGSSARASITDGPNSISEPPDGVGVRESTGGGEINVYTDEVLADIANLRARYGSFDQSRIPNLAVELHRPGMLLSTTAGLAIAHLDVGGSVRVTGWPGYLPPDPVLLLVHGYRETLGRMLWQLKANTTAAGPYQTGLYDVSDQPAGLTRYGASTSSLNASVTTTATTIVVKGTARVTTVEVWTTVAGMYPQDIKIGGEQITLTQAPSGSTSPQTFANVTRSVNGVVAAHDADASVRRYTPTFYGL